MLDGSLAASNDVDEEEGHASLATTHVVCTASVSFVNGAKSSVRFLASRVDISGACRVTPLADTRPETIARLMRDHFEQLGGVPDVAAFEEPPASIFRRPSPHAPFRWDPSLVGALAAIGVEVGPPRNGARRLEAEVVAKFIDGRRFAGAWDLDQKLTSWCDLIAVRRVARSGEHACLKPLRSGPDGFFVPVEVQIGERGVMYIEGRKYVVPGVAGIRATALLYPSLVRVQAGGAETVLPRAPRRSLRASISRRPW